MDRPRLKLVTMKPPKKVPEGAEPLTVAGIAGQVPLQTDSVLKTESVLAEQIMASIDRLERMMLNFSKDLANLGSGLDFTEARLNRVVRLTKTLATLNGIPD